jgi:polysaccharide pyruvyl transferase CsaB
MGKSGSHQNVVIVGAYGCGNTGDDAILAGLLRLFQTSGWQISVLSDAKPRLYRCDRLHLIRQQLNRGFSWSVLMSFDIRGIFWAIRNARIMVIGGGALLLDLRPYNLPYFFMLQTWAKFWKVRVIYFGIGAGPIQSGFGKWLTRRFLPLADHISVRDRRGREWLCDAGIKNVHVTADPAFLLSPEDVPVNELKDIIEQERLPRQFIAVTACGWFKSDDFWHQKALDQTNSEQRMAKIFDWIIEKSGKPVVFFPTVTPYDRTLSEHIKERMEHRLSFQCLHGDHPVEILMGLLGRAEWLIGMRLHSMILATIMQVPFFGIVYDPKVQYFMDSVGNPHYIRLEDMGNPSVFRKIEVFMAGSGRLRSHLRMYPHQAKESLLKDFNTISKTLHIGSRASGGRYAG